MENCRSWWTLAVAGAGGGSTSGANQTIEQRVAGLEVRLRLAEDELAIRRLLASYGPAVDSRSGAATRDL